MIAQVVHDVLLAGLIGVVWWRTDVLAKRLVAREQAMDKHLKAVSREAQIAVKEAKRLHDNAHALQGSANALLSDQRVQRLLNEER